MADVVRNGAIFRVKNPSTMRSPMPRLPVARGRIASATPETPAAKRGPGRVRSALESVVPRAPIVPQQQQQHQLKRRLKTVNKRGGSQRKGQPLTDDASVRANFNRLVSESETWQAAKRVEGSESGSSAKMVREEEEAEERSVEERGASSDSGDEASLAQQPRAKGRKRPRAQPEEEPAEEEQEEEIENEEEDAEEEEEEEEEQAENASSEEMVTPQPRRRKDASSEDDADENEEGDDEGVTVQKRLMYDDTPPAKTKPVVKPKTPSTKSTAAAQRKRKPKAKPSEAKIPVAAGGLEFLSMSSAATPSRSTRIRTGVMVMSDWYLEWPPPFVGDELQLVLFGQVLGQGSAFTVQRRVTDVQFISTDNQNVRLSGCLDIERAQRTDVPPVVMELLVEGIPTNWRQVIDSYAPPPDPWMPLSVKSKEKAKQKNTKAAAAAAAAQAGRKTSVPIPGVTKRSSAKATKSPKAIKVRAEKAVLSEPATPIVDKRSRSGRHLTPVMEWWRNERKVMDANFDTKIVEGSPAHLPSNRVTAISDAATAARQKIQEIYDAQRKSAEWSDAQLAALHDAKAQVPTTHPNFWGHVATLVPGKSADECRARSFDDLPVAPTRKGTGRGTTPAKKQLVAATQMPVKIHRAGSNLFKKQVRQFVRDQEHKNVDDLFSLSTPSKEAIAGASGLDDLKSPSAPIADTHTHDGDDSDDDALLAGGAGRELLEKVSLSKRDDVDSYVRTLKRGNDNLGLKAVRTSSTTTSALTTPPAKKKPRRESVHMTTEVGAHVLEAIVTPGGTTRVRLEKGSDDEDMVDEEEEEEEEEAALSDSF